MENFIKISVEWKKSRKYGLNPHAVAQLIDENGTILKTVSSKTSGYGYDKLSQVVTECLYKLRIYKEYPSPAGINYVYSVLLEDGYKLYHLFNTKYFDGFIIKPVGRKKLSKLK